MTKLIGLVAVVAMLVSGVAVAAFAGDSDEPVGLEDQVNETAGATLGTDGGAGDSAELPIAPDENPGPMGIAMGECNGVSCDDSPDAKQHGIEDGSAIGTGMLMPVPALIDGVESTSSGSSGSADAFGEGCTVTGDMVVCVDPPAPISEPSSDGGLVYPGPGPEQEPTTTPLEEVTPVDLLVVGDPDVADELEQ